MLIKLPIGSHWFITDKASNKYRLDPNNSYPILKIREVIGHTTHTTELCYATINIDNDLVWLKRHHLQWQNTTCNISEDECKKRLLLNRIDNIFTLSEEINVLELKNILKEIIEFL